MKNENIIEKVILDSINAGNEKITRDDYIDENGLTICAKCHTPKQCIIDWFGAKKIIVPCLCKCGIERRNEEINQQEEHQKQTKIQEKRRIGFTDKEYELWTFANDDKANEKISDLCQRYVNKWDKMKKGNTGLIFHGVPGVGKTFYACCIANAVVEMGYNVLVTSLPKLVAVMAGLNNRYDDIMYMLERFDLVVIDDLGVERGTEYSLEKVHEIIDTRYRSGKPLIITTNLTKAEISFPSDIKYKRIYDRITEMCIPILIKGEPRRKNKSESKIKAAKELLGYNDN